jgi:hypothetical protein
LIMFYALLLILPLMKCCLTMIILMNSSCWKVWLIIILIMGKVFGKSFWAKFLGKVFVACKYLLKSLLDLI